MEHAGRVVVPGGRENRMNANFNASAAGQLRFPSWDELVECHPVNERPKTERVDDDPAVIALCLRCPLAECKPAARACPLNGIGFLAEEKQRSYNRKAKMKQRERLGNLEMNRKERMWKAAWRERQKEKSA